MDNVELADGAQTNSRAFNFALPTTLKNKEEIVFLVQHNTPIQDVENCGENAIADWARLKRREQRMRRTWKCAELLVTLKAAIHRAHKENMDENDLPICLALKNWRRTSVKKERPNTPILLPRVMKEEAVTPDLQYPASEPSDILLDPNDFDWGSDAW